MSASIKENIKNTAVELIALKLRDTMLNLAFDMCDLHLSKPDTELPESISKAIDSVRDYTVKLTEILDTDLADRAIYVNGLNKLKSDYIDLCRPLQLYINRLNLAGGYAMQLYKCKAAEEMPLDSYAQVESALREHILQFIAESTIPYEKHHRMSSVLSLIPSRLTKERFNDIMRAGIKATLENSNVKDALSAATLLRTTFCPALEDNYGIIFPDIKETAEELCTRQIDKLDREGLESYLDEMDTIMAQLSELEDYLYIVYNDINYLIALASTAVDENYLTGDDVLVRDTLYSCRDMLQSKDYELYAESLADKASEQIEEGFPELSAAHAKLGDYIEYDSKLIDTDEGLMNTINIYANIHLLYISELATELTRAASNDDSPASEEFINGLIDNIMDRLNRMPSYISAAKNKFVRSTFLGVVPVIMSDSEFSVYLDYALEPLHGTGKGIASLTDIHNLLVDHGVISVPYDDDEDEDDCECGCGHHSHSHSHSHSHHQGQGQGQGHDHEHEHEHHHSHLHVVHDHEHDCNCGHEH
jgi:hypothetical protein